LAKALAPKTPKRTSKFSQIAQYKIRSSFYHRKSKTIQDAQKILDSKSKDFKTLDWNHTSELGITQRAFDSIKARGLEPARIFAHPRLLQSEPKLILYYRSLACISQKGIRVMGIDTTKREEEGEEIARDKAIELAKLLNANISEIVESDLDFNMASALTLINMSYGSQVNGSWRNSIGTEGSRRVKQILLSYLRDEKLIDSFILKDGTTEIGQANLSPDQISTIVLKNRMTIKFKTDPDIELLGPEGRLIAVVEIKAGVDPAGALERYGASLKSFRHAIERNDSAQTIYLGILTDTIEKRMKDDKIVKKHFEIVDTFAGGAQRKEFLSYFRDLIGL
jgi:hypothetical protein